MQAKLPTLSAQKQQLLDEIVSRLRTIPGMVAVVLGGSYASGTQQAGSDLDIGLYYRETQPFSIEAVRAVADEISAGAAPTVTGFYEWGPWVNGGAWIQTAQGKVDFLYRNLDQVQRTITDAQAGISQHDYDQQPTHGFYSVMYLAETHICIPYYDPEGQITVLKQQVQVYPPKLKAKIIADSLWSAEFTLLFGRDYAAQADIYNTVGCLVRAAANLTQALFALNERYFIRDKRVMQTMAGFALLPEGFIDQVNQLLAHPGSSQQALQQSVNQMVQVWHGVTALDGVQYEPKFQV